MAHKLSRVFFFALQFRPEFSTGNFDLYQDRAPELFNRARAKLLLEIEGRPVIRVLRHLGREAQELKKKGRSRAWKLKTVLDWPKGHS